MTPAARAEEQLVTVIIPTRDRCQRLLTTLRSVLAQRDVDLEVVVVDDGSRDNTFETVTRLGDPRIRVVRNEEPRGESGARNRGLDAARGAWIAFLDDDDLWAPEKLSRQLHALLETGRDWAYAGDVAVDAGLRILYGSPPPGPEEVMTSLRRHNSVPASASSVVARSELLARVGPFDRGLRRTADWDMWLRFAQIGPPACVREPLVALCVHPGNMSRDMPGMFHELDVLADRYRIPVDRARHYRWAAWGARLDGSRWGALGYYARAVAAGDLRSVGRAAVALVHPVPGIRGRARRDPWAQEARAWLDAIPRGRVSGSV